MSNSARRSLTAESLLTAPEDSTCSASGRDFSSAVISPVGTPLLDLLRLFSHFIRDCLHDFKGDEFEHSSFDFLPHAVLG